MNRRNLTTSFMVVGAGLLLFGGVALAREVQTREDRTNPAIVSSTHDVLDDNGGTRNQPEVGDDRGGNGSDDAATPTATASFDDNGVDANDSNDDSVGPMATFDDHGGLLGNDGSDDAAGATASPDDHGNGNGSDDAAGATASPDDHGNGNGSDETTTPRPTNAPTATATASPDDHGSHATSIPSATASPDDHGGSGGHGGGNH